MDVTCRKFQNTVSEYLIRHRSILDVMSKIQESTAHVNRAVVEATTSCGCINIRATKQPVPEQEDLQFTETHVEGELCPTCYETIETHLGTTLFYITGLCGLLEFDLGKVIECEHDRISALGTFSLT